MVERVTDWPQKLSEFLKERHSAPFQWGENDCMAFTAEAVKRLTGEDFFKDFSDYSGEDSAKDMLDKNLGVVGIITKCLGTGTRNYLSAKRGDVVIVKMPAITGGIVDDSGEKIAVVTPEGLRRLPLNKAWRVWSY